MTYTVLESIATANPPTKGTQQQAAAFMAQVTSLPLPIRNRIQTIYDRSGIDHRHTCIPDYMMDDPSRFEFFGRNWSLEPAPSTAERNSLYRRHVVPMAEVAARRALDDAAIAASEITHVVVASCTGFFAPGLDIELVKRLEMRPSTQRTLVGFMGCYAAFNAMRLAHAFCQSVVDARVLVVCAELCTLHFKVDDTLERVVVNSLFADGAAAVFAARPEAEARGRLSYAGSQTMLDDDSMNDMTWNIGDTGFDMTLSARVPSVIAEHLPAFVDQLAGCVGGRERVGFWAIHPGGRAIVEKAQDVLGLQDDDVADSFGVLREFGNMSSPTILFVLKRILDRHRSGEPIGDGGLAMAFGPGLTLEGAAFRVGR